MCMLAIQVHVPCALGACKCGTGPTHTCSLVYTPEALSIFAVFHLLELRLGDLQCRACWCLDGKDGVIPASGCQACRVSNMLLHTANTKDEPGPPGTVSHIVAVQCLIKQGCHCRCLLEAGEVCDVLIRHIEVWLVGGCFCHGLDAAGHLVDVCFQGGISILYTI